jgi:hypothetical protein
MRPALKTHGGKFYRHSWERHEFEMANHSGQTEVKTRRVEVVWMSPSCDRFELMS